MDSSMAGRWSTALRTRPFARRWRLVLMRGAGMILFGLAALARPQLGLAVFLALFVVYALVDGAMAAAAALWNGPGPRRWWFGLAGAASLLAAAGITLAPGVGAAARLWLVGFWAVLRGLIGVADGLTAGRDSGQGWRLISAAAVPLGFGLMLLARPGAGAVALTWLVGSWAFVLGVVTILLALELRRTAADSEA